MECAGWRCERPHTDRAGSAALGKAAPQPSQAPLHHPGREEAGVTPFWRNDEDRRVTDTSGARRRGHPNVGWHPQAPKRITTAP